MRIAVVACSQNQLVCLVPNVPQDTGRPKVARPKEDGNRLPYKHIDGSALLSHGAWQLIHDDSIAFFIPYGLFGYSDDAYDVVGVWR